MSDAAGEPEPPQPPQPSAPPARDVRRRRRGASGVAAAIAMGMREVFDPPKDDVAVTVEAPGEPGDIDRDGITVAGADYAASTPALPPLPDDVAARTRRRSSKRR